MGKNRNKLGGGTILAVKKIVMYPDEILEQPCKVTNLIKN